MADVFSHRGWRTDGTPQGTQPLMAWTPPIFLTTGYLPLEREGLVYFGAHNSEHGHELWTTDGTEGGTVLLKDIVATTGDVSPRIFGVAGGLLVFDQREEIETHGLYATDGTPPGTKLALDLAPGESSSLPRWVGPHAGRVFRIFSADPESRSPSLRSLVPPGAAPFFPGLELAAWAGDTMSLSLVRFVSLIEAPPGVTVQLESGADQSAALGKPLSPGSVPPDRPATRTHQSAASAHPSTFPALARTDPTRRSTITRTREARLPSCGNQRDHRADGQGRRPGSPTPATVGRPLACTILREITRPRAVFPFPESPGSS